MLFWKPARPAHSVALAGFTVLQGDTAPQTQGCANSISKLENDSGRSAPRRKYAYLI